MRACSSTALLLAACSVTLAATAFASDGGPAGDTLTVHPGSVLHVLAPTFQGINYVGFWDKDQGSGSSAMALAQTAIRIVRFPGGAPADWYDWQCPYYDKTTPCPSSPNSSSWSSTAPLDLWHYAQKLGGGALPLFGTNVQGNLPDPPGASYTVSSPQNQAAWASYDKAQGIPALFEIGNEEDTAAGALPGSCNGETDAQRLAQLQPYIDAFNGQATAIHGAVSTATVFGPVATNEYFWWACNGLALFLEKTGNKSGTGAVDGVSLHFYKGATFDDSKGVPQYWLGAGGPWDYISQTIAANDTRPLPLFVSEWHLGNSDGSFNPTMANALVSADMIGAFAASGVAGEQYFDVHGAAYSSNAFGLLYGDGDGRPLDSPTPLYYAMALLSHLGSSLVALDQSVDPASIVSAYATTKADGSLQLLAINKTATGQPLAIGGLGGATGASIYTVSPASGNLTDLDALYDGQMNPPYTSPLPAPATTSVTAGSFSYTLPPYTVALLDFAGVTTATTDGGVASGDGGGAAAPDGRGGSSVPTTSAGCGCAIGGALSGAGGTVLVLLFAGLVLGVSLARPRRRAASQRRS